MSLRRAPVRVVVDIRRHFIEVPRIVRMKPCALNRIGLYLARPNLRRIFLVQSMAVCLAPSIKDDFYTILSERDQTTEVEAIIEKDSHLRGCFAE